MGNGGVGDPLGEALQASDEAEGVMSSVPPKRRPVFGSTLFELFIILFILIGIAAIFFLMNELKDKTPPPGEAPGQHHDDGSETPTFNLGGLRYQVVLSVNGAHTA